MRNNPNYQPQANEDLDQIPVEQPQEPHNPWPEIIKKGLNIILKFILCLNILGLIPQCGVFYYFMIQISDIKQMEGPMFEAIETISTNIKAGPIMDIQIVNYGSSCPSGFKALKLGDWPGIIAGCLCDNGDLHDRSCKKIDSEKCKTDIPSTYPFEMYAWDGSVLCVKRAALGTDYLRQTECPAGYQECYSGGCFKGDCPITKLEIASSGTITNKFNGKDKFLILTKTQGELPLINIQLTLGDIPCFIQDLSRQAIKNSSYILSSIQENSCDKYGLNSEFSTRLASQTAYQSFTQNYFPYSVMDLPYFEENANSTISILSWMTRMRTAKNEYCLDIDENFANNFIHGSYSVFRILIPPVMVGIQLGLISIILSLIEQNNRNQLDEDKLSFAFFIQIVVCVLFLIGIGLFYRFYQPFHAMKGYIEGYDSLECFGGGQGSMVISDYLEMVDKIGARFWTNFADQILCGLHILILIAFYFVIKIS